MAGSYTTTTNFGLHVLLGSSKVADIDEGFAKLAGDIDAKMLGYVADTFAKRPAAGVSNRIFRATDTGTLYSDTGTEWVPLVRGSGGASASVLSWGVVEGTTATGRVPVLLGGSGDFTLVEVDENKYDVKWTKERASAIYAVTAQIRTPQTSQSEMTIENVTKTGFRVHHQGGLGNGLVSSWVAVSAG